VEQDSGPRAAGLGQLRLLVALDALLVAGGVSGAAKRLGLSPAATSRLLAQIRKAIGDPVFIRAGRRMVPTARAEELRLKVRGLVASAQGLLQPEPAPASASAGAADGWTVSGLPEPPALRIRASLLDQERPAGARLPPVEAGEDGEPRARLARYLGLIGRSNGLARPLTAPEAEDAFGILLEGQADPMQVGALLLVMNARNETAPELAGIVRAARRHVGALDLEPAGSGRVDLDWPAYVSPQARRPPWFMLSAVLVARAGHRLLLHGHCGSGETRGQLERAAQALCIPICRSLAQAQAAVERERIAFLPLSALSPQIYRLMALHRLFDSRSPMSSAVHLLNPLGARRVLVGAVRAGYRELHRDAALLLGWPSLTALGEGRDVAQLAPFKPVTVHAIAGGRPVSFVLPREPEAEAMGAGGLTSFEYWRAVWDGTTRDVHARETIIATAALALLALGGGGAEAYRAHQATARELWEQRHAGGPRSRPATARPH